LDTLQSKGISGTFGHFFLRGKRKNDFNNLLNTHFNQPQHVLCGHNAKEFDIPFIARRMIINQIVIPNKFILKPWEIHIWIPWNYGSWRLQALHLFKINVQSA
jgi:hypothetical protein